MRLIEKKNDSVGVTVDNGALINWASVGGQNGALTGFTLSLSSGYLVATKGRLIVQGFTFEIIDSSEQLYNLAAYSVDSSEERTLYLKINYDFLLSNYRTCIYSIINFMKCYSCVFFIIKYRQSCCIHPFIAW